MSDKPDPPVSADVDLKDFAFTPIYRARLFGSSFHARATDAEWRAGVTLWLKSQDQMPAGSLPTDDVVLCRLAELGRDIRAWNKVKDGALHGWYECSDGRLYHDVVAQVVNEQWKHKISRAARTAAARAARAANRQPAGDSGETDSEFNVPPQSRHTFASGSQFPSAGPGRAVDRAYPSDNARNKPSVTDVVAASVTDNVTGSKGQGQGQGQGHIDSEDPNGPSGADAPNPDAPPVRDPTKELWDRGIAQLGNSSRSLMGKARREYGDLAVMAAIIACEQEAPSKPVEFFLKCLETRKHHGNGKQQSPVAKLYEGALLAAEEWERRQGNCGDNFAPHVPLLDRRRPH